MRQIEGGADVALRGGSTISMVDASRAVKSNRRGLWTWTTVGAAGLSLFWGGCGPAQRAVERQPIVFLDSQSGAPLDHVLVVPKYISSKGVGTDAGHGPVASTSSLRLAYPFVYHHRAAFAPRQPDTVGVGLPPLVFAGRSDMISGVVVIAPGHQSRWYSQLWQRPTDTTVTLESIAEVQSVAHMKRLQTLLLGTRIVGSDLTDKELRLFNLVETMDMEVSFNEEERRVVREFLK